MHTETKYPKSTSFDLKDYPHPISRRENLDTRDLNEELSSNDEF